MVQENHINQAHVRRAFDHSAAQYNENAVLQREVAERLSQHLEFAKLKPARILDVGCGTGMLMELLRKRYRRAAIHGVDISAAMLMTAREDLGHGAFLKGKYTFTLADAEQLPLADASYDLVCSNLTLQWMNDPSLMIHEMRRVLAPGGLMLFSTFGRRTLAELRQSLAHIDRNRAGLVLPFPDVVRLGDMLANLPDTHRVETTVTDVDLFTLTYPDTMALVRELKQWGASSAAIAHRPSGLYGRSLLRRLQSNYAEEHGMEDGRVRASFEILYAQAWYAESASNHSDVIPIQEMP